MEGFVFALCFRKFLAAIGTQGGVLDAGNLLLPFLEEIGRDLLDALNSVLNRRRFLIAALIIRIEFIVDFFEITALKTIKLLQAREGIFELFGRRLLIVACFFDVVLEQIAFVFSELFPGGVIGIAATG